MDFSGHHILWVKKRHVSDAAGGCETCRFFVISTYSIVVVALSLWNVHHVVPALFQIAF